MPVTVSLALLASLQDVVGQTEGDLQGVLYGDRLLSGTEVRRCRPVPAFSPASMGRAATEREVIGYYRVRHADAMQLTDIEMAIADTSFAKPGAVVLLIQRVDGVAQGNFFFRENDAFVNFPLLTFPLDVGLLDERVVVAGASSPALSNAARTTESPKRTWVGIAAGAAALVAALAGGAWYLGHRPVAAEVPRPVAVNTAPLPLRAERQGDDLKVMWDLGSAAVANAVSGVIDIEDGGVKRRIPLDERQVRFGSMLYTPKSDEVSIDMTAVKADGSAGQASVLVLLTRTGKGAAPQLRNVASVPAQSQADRRFAPPASVPPAAVPRAFVAPPAVKQQSATHPAEMNLPEAQMRTDTVAALHLPPVAAPAPPPPAPQVRQGPPVVSATPTQRVVPPPVGAASRASQSAAGSVFYAPQLVSQVGARVPPELRGFLTRPFTVTVRATIDETGRVIHADTPTQKVIHVGFLSAATEAAMHCRFIPARRGNTPVKGEAVLTFRFQPH